MTEDIVHLTEEAMTEVTAHTSMTEDIMTHHTEEEAMVDMTSGAARGDLTRVKTIKRTKIVAKKVLNVASLWKNPVSYNLRNMYVIIT